MQRSTLIGPGIFVVLVVASLGLPAHAAEGPLLVVVEAPPSLDADAAEIRKAIGAELRSQTSAPMKTTGEPADRALIVALDGERIAMSLRTGDAAPIGRVIPAPAEHAARLRAIAWLAGNLARDQVTPILAEMENPPSVPTANVPLVPSASPDTDAAATAPADGSLIEPPRFEVPAATVTAHVDPERHQSSWTFGAATGPAISTYGFGHALRQSIFGSWTLGSSLYDVFHDYGTIWRVEVRRRAVDSRLFTGFALEGSTGEGFGQQEIFGGMAFAGSALHFGRWSLEGSLGVGIDLDERPVPTNPVVTFGSGGEVSTTYPHDTLLRPSLFAAGGLAVSHPVFESIDLCLAIDAHVSTTDRYDGYLASMIGLRYHL